MKLFLTIEEVHPERDYTAICYTVKDCDSGEVIWRTADKTKAELLVSNFNAASGIAVLETEITHQHEAYDRLNARYKRAVSALKEIGTCGTCADCGLCGERKCPDSTYVATARAALREIGLKIPTAEEGKSK